MRDFLFIAWGNLVHSLGESAAESSRLCSAFVFTLRARVGKYSVLFTDIPSFCASFSTAHFRHFTSVTFFFSPLSTAPIIRITSLNKPILLISSCGG